MSKSKTEKANEICKSMFLKGISVKDLSGKCGIPEEELKEFLRGKPVFGKNEVSRLEEFIRNR